MAISDDAKGKLGERGRERHVMLTHPQSAVVHGLRHFYPYGCTPPENLLGNVPKDAERADLLLLGCSDARHVLFTLWMYASERSCGSRGRLPSPACRLRTLRFTLNDREPACLARVLLLLQLFVDSNDELFAASRTDASQVDRDAYAARIGVCFNAYYNVYVDTATMNAVQMSATRLLEASASPTLWRRTMLGGITHIAGRDTLNRLRSMWYTYADTSMGELKPKAALDKERSAYHKRVVMPQKNLSSRVLSGEGAGMAAMLAMEWSAEMTGVHRCYQTWGYVDPFPVLLNNGKRTAKIYTKTNPAMLATDHQELKFQLHHSCNPFSTFHLDHVWVDFVPAEMMSESGDVDDADSANKGPPVVCAGNFYDWVVERREDFDGVSLRSDGSSDVQDSEEDDDDDVESKEARKYLESKLLVSSLEQMSKMCWALNWATHEVLAAPSAPLDDQGEATGVDVRINILLGDAVDTCDAICSLSDEGLRASGVAHDGEERPDRVCGFMPNMSLTPYRLELADIGGPARFDFIDTSDLSDSLGVLNVVMAASPLLKPVQHATLRTDLRRRGVSRKSAVLAKDVMKGKCGDPARSGDAYALLTEEDWCTTKVHECAVLLGVVPVSSVSPFVGHFHSVLEAARIAKTNKQNADVGDLGQRLRLCWKQACLMDQRAGSYVELKHRTPLTLHPRLEIAPGTFVSMLMPFWAFMTRSIFFESNDCAKIGERDERQIRVSPYTPASFARLISHSLRFLKLDRKHFSQVFEDVRAYSKGLFDADVASQMDVYLHLLGLYTTEMIGTEDVLRWARECPWWVRKPPAKGSTVVPAGSPGVCRVVIIAPPAAVSIIRQLHSPSLCVVLDDEKQRERMLFSTLHCCFVRVDRGGGGFLSSPGEQGKGTEGNPWYVIKDGLLRVKETAPDDEGAELMVSFLMASHRLVNVAFAADVELELRLQDSESRHVADPRVAKTLEKANGVIFRTNLAERRETAVVFPSRNAGATALERWVPQSAKWTARLLNDKGLEAGLEQRRVGKQNRYIITPGRPVMCVPPARWEMKRGAWMQQAPMGKPSNFLWTLHMSNPAARSLLESDQTMIITATSPPCSVEIALNAPEKSHGKGSKHRATANDSRKGGIDGGLTFLLVLPYPVGEGDIEVATRRDCLILNVPLLQDYLRNPFLNFVQAEDSSGRRFSKPLLSNWTFPVRRTANNRTLNVSHADSRKWVKQVLQPRFGGLVPPGRTSRTPDPVMRMHMTIEELILKHVRHVREADTSEGNIGLFHLPWHVLRARDPIMLIYVQDILVDQSNEALLVDLCVMPMMAGPDGFYDLLKQDILEGDRLCFHEIDKKEASLWWDVLPMAVERGRRTYAHGPDCLYKSTGEAVSLCACGGGKDIPREVSGFFAREGPPSEFEPRSEMEKRLYRAVLPALIPVSGLRNFGREPFYRETAFVGDCNGSEDDEQLLCDEFATVPTYLGPAMSYTGPFKERGSIVEVVPAMNADNRDHRDIPGRGKEPPRVVSSPLANGGGISGESNGLEMGQPSKKTKALLMKAGLRRMPKTANEWVRFERVKKGLNPEAPCAQCKAPQAPKRCKQCKDVNYCSRECQLKHWKIHKIFCN